MILLAISTSSPRGTVVVARGGDVLARVAYDGGTSHAERLFAAIDEALATAGVDKTQLRALACDVGPGSFTGVRVALATCQGIALGLGVPVVGVGSLEAMAHAARRVGGAQRVLPVLDARKEEVFAAVLDIDGGVLWGPLHLPAADGAELATTAARFGATLSGEFAAKLGLAGVARGEALDLPDASSVAQLGAQWLASAPAGAGDPGALEPRYVRAPDAKPMELQRRPSVPVGALAAGPPAPSPVPTDLATELGASEPQAE
jgi:tRNA threonylcarbamoyladenosine biosynthesis protein TsaB